MLNLHQFYNQWADLPEMPDKDSEGNPLSTEDQERLAFQTAFCGCAAYLVGFILALLLCALFGSCTTTKYVPVIEHKTDTIIQTTHQRDSIHVHDSIRISEKGDTVRIDHWHTEWRDRWQHDTLYISKTDSIPVPYPVEKEVPAELTWWQQARLHLANILLYLLGIIAVVWIVRKKFLK